MPEPAAPTLLSAWSATVATAPDTIALIEAGGQEPRTRAELAASA